MLLIRSFAVNECICRVLKIRRSSMLELKFCGSGGFLNPRLSIRLEPCLRDDLAENTRLLRLRLERVLKEFLSMVPNGFIGACLMVE